MSIPCKFERSILSPDEYEIVLPSHHPGIYDRGVEDLKKLRHRLRDMRDRERTLAREKRREARGKAGPRGGSFPGTAEHALQRKQVFAAALKRVNKEISRMQKLEAREANIAAAHRALAGSLACRGAMKIACRFGPKSCCRPQRPTFASADPAASGVLI